MGNTGLILLAAAVAFVVLSGDKSDAGDAGKAAAKTDQEKKEDQVKANKPPHSPGDLVGGAVDLGVSIYNWIKGEQPQPDNGGASYSV